MRSRFVAVVFAVAGALAASPAAAVAANVWSFGPAGQSSARVIWSPDDGRNVNAVIFALPVKVKSASTARGQKCSIPDGHPKQVRCPIKPATAYGYINIATKVHIPCDRPFGFKVRPAGSSAFVRQTAIPSGNAC